MLEQYCFSGDEKLQDQSQIAQDIATLYAAIPDHTAVRGVSDKGRAQFTDFKYEKTEVGGADSVLADGLTPQAFSEIPEEQNCKYSSMIFLNRKKERKKLHIHAC